MFATQVTRGEKQTDKQFKWQVTWQRREDIHRRAFNNTVGFWRVCDKGLCRRNHGCSHDMHACFNRFWPLVPEDQKEYVRGCIKASKTTRSRKAIHRGGLAAMEEHFKTIARVEAVMAKHNAPVQPARVDTPEPEVKIRRL